MKNIDMVKQVASELPNVLYRNKEEVTQQLMELLDKLSKVELKTADDYIKIYDENFFTYPTWEALVYSEAYIGGLTEEECKEQLNQTIWQLPCGWYVQYV